MKTLAIIGLQWGDEGKGKIIDHLAGEFDITVRFQGGGNAGHTVVAEGKKHVLHHIPSGILHAGKTALIADGTVLDAEALFTEIADLESAGVSTGGRIRIGWGVHMVMPYHKALDAASEDGAGEKIGTTRRGIGPCYADRKARLGIRLKDLFDRDSLARRVEKSLAEKNCLFKNLYGRPEFGAGDIIGMCRTWADRLGDMGVDTPSYLRAAISSGRSVLFEGAQGSLLDTDWGTYPFVTSSTTSASAVASGCGISMKLVGRIMGVAKAYTTRVGEGPFPTEDKGAVGEHLRRRGGEFGATTGRPRRCGWLDAVATRYAVDLNGADSLVVTKLDVLTGVDPIKICISYGPSGGMGADPRIPRRVVPEYVTFPGWKEDISSARSVSDLPGTCRSYLDSIERLVGAPIGLISVGPDRRQVFEKD